MAFLGLGESAQVAIVGGFVTVFTLGLSQYVNFRQSQEGRKERLAEKQAELDARGKERLSENSEWYRRTLFERQLQAVNDAYVWVMKLNVLMNRVTGPVDARAANGIELVETARQAREWYDTNVIYLYDGMPGSSSFVGLTNAAAGMGARGDSQGAWNQFNDAYKEVTRRASEVMGRIIE